jgi:HEAT repeat protein
MKAIMVLALAGALGWVVWQNFLKPAPPPPPPPPPPPAILIEPAPILSDAELQKVLKSAQDSEPTVRWEAVLYLDKVKAPQAMPLMFDMIQHDQEPDIRIKIIGLLGGRSGPDVLRALIGAAKDQEPEVRVAALRALDKIGDDSVAAAIADGPLRDQDEKVRTQAMRTLNSLQDKRLKRIADEQKAYEQAKAKAAADAAAARK